MKHPTRKTVFYSLFIIICYLLDITSTIAAEGNIIENYNKQIKELLKQEKCGQAESIAKKIANENTDLAILPEWYHQIIECHKKRHEGWGDLGLRIHEFINDQLDEFIKNNSCIEAEIYLNKIEKKFYVYWNYNIGLYKVAHCYEAADVKKSALLYQQIILDHPKSDKAKEAKQRLNYLSGDRAWIYPKPSAVIDGVKKGIRHKDIKLLEKYASKSNFQIGFEEELSPELFEDNGVKIIKSVFDRSSPQIGTLISESNRYMLLVVFSEEDYPFWYFTFDKIEGGWQWTGVIISNVDKSKE